ncbi:MAG: hypothetical protein ACTSRG_00155 [Candidatus Helarchaeota archaeon]
MGRPKKFEGKTKIVGFRIPVEKEDVFKRNVYNFLQVLLEENEEFLANCFISKWSDSDILYFMNFFQRNKDNLNINFKDRKFFEDVVERAKNVRLG